jgi:hypothetical protein
VKVGTLVQRWHDDGLASGASPYFGVVIRDCPRTVLVKWERGDVSRVRKAEPKGIAPVPDFNHSIALELLRKRGIEIPEKEAS